ncbi:MAG TPA: GTP 3',8-cyclase MoaA [Bacillota bacterium]|jgi:cyclic pyranopterin phosphate synthase|nr:GTP 3',8-cyclase MoaA [Bacillota bacterium]HOB86791.1 GTP 3',8-cyclase MoaA [Bacillota bacterium]HOP68335.1 GTP 3',8-cyclase MoaA [Bacillota bacterium]HPT33496.1 GTP 3',8-cyclase MoaA [Bacillota bacterium]HQD05800.1 GTP 3',8-cyclase MoaA [Bacillota bacterium]
MPLKDAYGRLHNYLRVSVTDRCNLRCRYCMGPEGVKNIPHEQILSYEEILQVIRAGARLGISRIRITGGEPLVRKNVVSLVEQTAQVPGIEDLSMTTNGLLLKKYAPDLKKAGLMRVNISIDSLKPEVYRYITRCGDLATVMAGLEAALELGLEPVKINTVLMKGINDGEVPAFLELARTWPVHVRFIEFMPIGIADRYSREYYLPLSFVLETAAAAGLELKPAAPPQGAGPAETYALPGGRGTVGLIHPISRHFCAGCNRLRLTADGHLKACLYWQEERSVRPALGNPEALEALLEEVVREKPHHHGMTAAAQSGDFDRGEMRSMNKTGG